jgi:hypothetical protein
VQPDDRRYVIDLVAETVGPAEHDHTWPWLVADDGALLTVDGYWPQHRVAVAIAVDPEPWQYAAAVAGLHGVALLVVEAECFPSEGGRLARRPEAIRGLLGADRFPPPPEDSDLGDGPGGWTTYVPLGGLQDDPFEDARDAWEEEQGRHGDEPWQTGGPRSLHEEDPWGDDDEPRDAPPAPDPGWRKRPIALAALGAAVLARRMYAREHLGDLEAFDVQLLAAVACASDGAPAHPSNTRGLAAQLAAPEDAVAGASSGLVQRALLEPDDDRPGAHRLTPEGRARLDTWLAAVAPAFGAWPSSPRDVDDAG